MRFEPGYLIGMALQTIPQPRVVARDIIALRFSRAVLWQTFALLSVCAMGFGVLGAMIYPPDPELLGPLFSNPISVGIIEAAIEVILIFAIYGIGRAFGGTGRFDATILVVLWLQFVTLLLQAAIILLLLFAPLMAALLQAMGFVLVFWILTHFITELHGFRSTGLVFVMILISIMALIFVLSLIFALIGVGVGTAGAL